MPTPLHDVDALVHLVETAPAPAASWASSRLAVIAPERFTRFPTEDLVHDVVILARPPGLEAALLEALATPPNPGVASADMNSSRTSRSPGCMLFKASSTRILSSARIAA